MSTALSGRARRVLGRFPRHLDADAPGKLIGAVVQALVRDQDVQTADLQAIRQAHRLGEARELRDLLLLGGLHGLRRAEMAVLFARQERLAVLLEALAAEGDGAARAQRARDLLALWSLPGNDPLRLFASDSGANPLDTDAAIKNLLPRATTAAAPQALLNGVRERIAVTARIHAGGNGTIRALITGAANALDLRPGEIAHSGDRFWHAAPVWDRMLLRGPDDNAIEPATEYLGLEENPRLPTSRGPNSRRHTELFHTIRKGFDEALLEIRVRGIGSRTVSPMIVNRDAGHGVGIFGQVPDGQELVFTQQGRVLLDGADITSRAWAWQGACFAATGAENIAGNGTQAINRQDFVYADGTFPPAELDANPRTSRFAVVTPPGALDREARLPHAGDSLPMPGIGVGKTRFAFFVQHGFFSAARPGISPELTSVIEPDLPFGVICDPFGSTPLAIRQRVHMVTPRFGVGFTDAAVFAGGDPVSGRLGDGGSAAAQVSLHWLEHQAYQVRVLIPNRFRRFDDRDGETIREQVRHAVQRFRPAGIQVQVDFVEDQWILGKATLPTADVTGVDPIGQIQSSTLLWPSPLPAKEEPQ